MVHDALVTAGILANDSSSSSASSNGHSDSMHAASNGNGHHTHAAGNGNGHHSSSEGSNGSSQRQQELPVPAKCGPDWTPSDPECPAWAAAWASICAVWASKWNHRAWLSRQSAGLPEEQLAVSVLIQQVRVGHVSTGLMTKFVTHMGRAVWGGDGGCDGGGVMENGGGDCPCRDPAGECVDKKRGVSHGSCN
jgi:hypothetical protein